MNDEYPSSGSPNRTWLEKISQLWQGGEPKTREDLITLLRDAKDNELIDDDSLHMLEGVLEVSQLRVRDIMIPRSQMVVVERDEPAEHWLPVVIESAHSRFPVIGESRDDVIGILLAKDLLRFCLGNNQRFNLREVLRPAVVVPESKRLDTLLKEFRHNRNHMAIVVDEYGGVSGLVTIEDILEQIVGDIEDEHDFEGEEEVLIQALDAERFQVNALTPIEDFNEHFHSRFSDEDVDTLGGLIMQAFGHLPRIGEELVLDGFQFRILEADNRRIHSLEVRPPQPTPDLS